MSFSAGNVAAQIRDDLASPAEVPPSSYKERQYVDSRGCVYIRAGIDGGVTWVPRVDRNRKVICGQTASGGAEKRVAEAPAPRPAPRVIEPAPKPVAAAPEPKPRPVARAAPPRPKKQPVRRAPAPRIVVEEPRAAPERRVVVRRSGELAPNTVLRSGDSVRSGPVVIVGNDRRVIRTTDDGVRVYAGKSGATHVTGNTVVAPKRAYEQGASVKVPVPPGYQPAFDDDRLSTTRAHQTLNGRRKMLLTWTNTVPRRLVDKYTGEEVRHYFPDLQYPYTSMRQQRAAMVSTRGEVPKAAPRQMRQVRKVHTPAPVMAASHRFIQVGSFSSRATAQGAIARLQGAGLPVRVNEYTSAGTHYFMVLAGPFQRQDQLRAALDTVRHRIGYRSASLRD